MDKAEQRVEREPDVPERDGLSRVMADAPFATDEQHRDGCHRGQGGGVMTRTARERHRRLMQLAKGFGETG